MKPNLTISIHRTELEIAAIVPQWLAIFESRPEHQFFHHPSWYLALQATLCEGNLAICLLEDEDGPLAVLPFVCSSPRIGEPVLNSPTHDHISLTDWIVENSAVLEDIISALPDISAALGLTGWSKVAGLSIPESSKTLKPVDVKPDHSEATSAPENNKSLCSRMGVYRQRTRFVRESYWLSSLVPSEHLRSKLKGNLRRRRKKAALQGNVNFVAVCNFPELEPAFQEFLSIEASGWKGENGRATAIASSPLLRDFYTRLLHADIPGLKAEIYLLSIGEKNIAAQFVLNTKSVSSLLKPAYNESYSEVSPGLLLMEDVLNYCATETNIETVSLVTSPPWAEPWHPKRIRVFNNNLYNNNLSGNAHALIDSVKDSIRNFRSKKS